MRFVTTLTLLALGILPATADNPVFQEKQGILIMEAESTSSRLSRWKPKTFLEGFTGECHLEFTGNKPESGPATSPLKYEFQINKPGKYTLILRAHKRLESKRQDISNDCYVAMRGEFEAGGSAPKKILRDDTKLFGGDAKTWGWARTLDANHKKYPAEYIFNAGETYQLTISGRSKNFNIDRIILVHEDANTRKAQDPKTPQSDTDAPLEETTTTERTTRTLHDLNGRAIKAELIEKNGNVLVALVKGKRYEIDIDTLSEEDQDFLRTWPSNEEE